ncbi:MAG: hypothetical protein KC615_10210 [Anaerolineae bacterium]|nr:hypothetical protein [Anaerolineae bacterium]
MRRFLWGAIGICACLLTIGVALADSDGTWDVFLERGTSDGADSLIFVDVLTGETHEMVTHGERYTRLRNGILYYDASQQVVLFAQPDQAEPQAHPYIHMDPDARRIDWTTSDDKRQIAWTLTYGSPEAITTVTHVLSADGTGPHEVLSDGPQIGVRVLPIAFSDDGNRLFVDMYPDGLERYVAYSQYAGLHQLDLETGELTPLPGEPGCFCGAGIRGNSFVRLSLNSDPSAFDVRYYNLASDRAVTIPAQGFNNFTQAGDVLLTSDGLQAVYALSDVSDFGTAQQSIRTVFMLVDLRAMRQRPLTEPITTYVHPLQWTEDNSAILFTSTQNNGTWKVSLETGQLQKVAEAAFLGSIQE